MGKEAKQESSLHDAVKLLLARMESHPEEFSSGAGFGPKWHILITHYEDYLTVEEQKALNEKIREIRMQQFHEDVMKRLLDDEMGNGEEAKSAKVPWTGATYAPFSNNAASSNSSGAYIPLQAVGTSSCLSNGLAQQQANIQNQHAYIQQLLAAQKRAETYKEKINEQKSWLGGLLGGLK